MLFRNYLHMKMGVALHLNTRESFSLNAALCQVWINWPSGSAEEDFKIMSMYFMYFVNISPWKRAWPIIWTNLNPFHPKKHCTKFCWNWLGGSGEDFQKISSMSFRCFVFFVFLLLEKGIALHLNKLEFPSPTNAFLPILV